MPKSNQSNSGLPSYVDDTSFDMPDNIDQFVIGQHYLDPEIANLRGRDAVVSIMATAHDGYRELLDTLRDARSRRDPAQTASGQLVSLHDKADKALARAAERGSEATKACDRALAEIDAEIDAAFNIPDPVGGAEIRGHFKNLPADNDRLTLAFEAVARGDKTTIGALLSQPGYLSGLSDESKAVVREQYINTHAPHLTERKSILAKARKHNFEACNTALIAFGEMFPTDKIAEIKGRSKAARDLADRLAN